MGKSGPSLQRYQFLEHANDYYKLTAPTDGDMVLVKRIGGRDEDEGNLITLNTSHRAETHRGTIPHTQIIGRRSGELVRSHVGKQFRVFEPSLAEYVTLSRRLVTPVRCCYFHSLRHRV
jgi:hypothetical protein